MVTFLTPVQGLKSERLFIFKHQLRSKMLVFHFVNPHSLCPHPQTHRVWDDPANTEWSEDSANVLQSIAQTHENPCEVGAEVKVVDVEAAEHESSECDCQSDERHGRHSVTFNKA